MENSLQRSQEYVAIIGDVVRSRDVSERGVIQGRLRAGIERVNEKFASQIVSRFILTIGDEFQGLLKSIDELLPLLAVLRAAIHPVEQRIGIGVGVLDTAIEEVALGMDGPCFHRARSAIERAKISGTLLEVDTEGGDETFRIYALLYAGLRHGWTPRQRQVFDLSIAGHSGKEIAAMLEISPSAVSQHLKAVQAESVLNATDIWLQTLQAAFLREE